ncbi:hypothetical protein GYMLUDRAFT_263848 [Collybiopsis luxurians FD-317 M1]|uniref:NAD(P)-binding protein n=1 Tax=Collybiopsis luxurians FD-317 M1 TaxID=944289 RepID=A0A0D0AZK9_9AGAR|nr:hypothetical protein GYMLUDRAFT_263848 [Collybiopsis luxurians FD-317 M1]
MLGLGAFRKKQWGTESIPDLTGRVAIVTGGNTGLGYITVRELARKGAHVYMFSRTESRALAAIEKIKKELGPEVEPKLDYVNFDLQKLSSAKQAASEFLKREHRLDILVNNAATMGIPYELSSDGIELQACNGTGHFALTSLLLPLMKETAAKPDSHVRIVNVSSGLYEAAGSPDFSSLEGLNQKSWSSWGRYAQSKLANILFTNELQKRLEESGCKNIYCLSIHPGMVATEITRGPLQSWPILSPIEPIAMLFAKTPLQGALTQLYAATSPEVEEKGLKSALLFPIAQPQAKKPLAEDKDGKLGAQYWKLCEKLVAEKA